MPRITDEPTDFPRVLIVAEQAGVRFGGESILPYHWFRLLRARGVPAWMVVHERSRDELAELLPAEDFARIRFVPDTATQKWLWRVGGRLPERMRTYLVSPASVFVTQRAAREVVRRVVAEQGIRVVHEPIPVSPRQPSMMADVGAPVVIGPMNGAMDYPPAFRGREDALTQLTVGLGRAAGELANRLIPGKRRAAALLVANPRTAAALPAGAAGRVIQLPENGVDLSLWRAGPRRVRRRGEPARFGFVGRLVDWKAVDLLIEAFARMSGVDAPGGRAAQLEIVGSGPERPRLEELAARLGAADRVTFAGWRDQAGCRDLMAGWDALVLPSLLECGGAVVLEALAVGLPVIATRWGGPADYLDDTCGILVEPAGREGFVAGLASAMARLAADPELAARLGGGGPARAAAFDWQAKVDRMLEIYRRAADDGGRPSRAHAVARRPAAPSVTTSPGDAAARSARNPALSRGEIITQRSAPPSLR